jgi:hypothetical protein
MRGGTRGLPVADHADCSSKLSCRGSIGCRLIMSSRGLFRDQLRPVAASDVAGGVKDAAGFASRYFAKTVADLI